MRLLISVFLVLCSLYSCTKKEAPTDIFSGSVWEAKVETETLLDNTISGYRLSFDQSGRYRITSLDREHYVYNVASEGVYKYEAPYLTLTQDRGATKVFVYRTSF